MTNNYYYFIPNGNVKEAGIITSPDRDKCPEILDAEEVKLNNDFIYELREGKYCPFDMGPHWVRLVDEELKELLEAYAEKEYTEFIPVMVRSKEYGDRQYYILHFKKIYDVIDKENSTYDPPGWIIKMCVDYAKVKNLHVFNSEPLINDLIVSTKVYKEIKKRKLNFGTSFGIHFCLNKDKYVTKK
ncbi:MAG: hypothetical protein PUG76_08175 [Prevotellaceae bacterium]|nr:hypothetical protein [Prevotellaceae bacterium]